MQQFFDNNKTGRHERAGLPEQKLVYSMAIKFTPEDIAYYQFEIVRIKKVCCCCGCDIPIGNEAVVGTKTHVVAKEDEGFYFFDHDHYSKASGSYIPPYDEPYCKAHPD